MSNFPGKVKVEKLPEEAQKRVYQWVHSSTAIFLFVIDIPENLLQLFILLTTIKVALGEWEGLNGGIFVSLIACIVICALICVAWMFWKINRLVESEGKLKGG
jgi:hypothetical protein